MGLIGTSQRRRAPDPGSTGFRKPCSPVPRDWGECLRKICSWLLGVRSYNQGMKMTLVGWNRKEKTHHHSLRPLPATGRNLGEEDADLTWDHGCVARARISSVSLTGDFEVKMEFSEGELRNWMRAYVVHNPRAALRLILEALPDALIESVGERMSRTESEQQ